MVSVSGFRGRVGSVLTPELVASLAASFGSFLLQEGAGASVCLGRDSRTSGAMLSRAASAGLESVGVDVVDLGMVPTPTLLLAVRHHRAAGGVAVTASHNPAEWNALKLVGPDAMFLDGSTSGRFLESVRDEDPERASWEALGARTTDAEAMERHVSAILASEFVDADAIRGRHLRVALDCVRGAGGPIMRDLLERLGCSVSGIGLEPDGRFPRDPEPTAAHLSDLGGLVRESGADIGLAVDPDVDRLSLVDETGRPLGEDFTLALAAAAVLSRRAGPVVTNLSTSRVVADVAEAYGSTVIRAPVGEINVARRMQAEDAVVGGEGNGGVILPDLHLTRDAPLAAALVLQHLVDTGGTVSAAAGAWPAYVIEKRKAGYPREALPEAYAALLDGVPPGVTDRSDGLRIEWADTRSWLHVRPSGTEPVVRLIAETPSGADVGAVLDRAEGILEASRT